MELNSDAKTTVEFTLRGLRSRSSMEEVERSVVYKAIKEHAAKLGLKKYGYIYMSYDQETGIEYLVQKKYGMNTISEESLEEIKKDKIEIVVDENEPIWTTTVNKNNKESIWKKERTLKTILYPTCGKATITFNGKVFHMITLGVFSTSYNEENYLSFIIYEIKDHKEFTDFINKLVKMYRVAQRKENKIRGLGKGCYVNKSLTWDDIVLSPEMLKRTKDDIECWMGAEERYNQLHVPYRRGYLFEGPPGNGKTAVSKIIMANYDFSIFTFDFSNHQVEDAHLYELFEEASSEAPSLILLEDIDRIFVPQDQQKHTNITLSAFLNCLDGAADYYGVVVIATANNPENLDPAIRKRPGRFDVPVRFDNPNENLRKRYLKFAFGRCDIGSVSNEAIEKVAKMTKGMSMAFIKSIFEKAAGQDPINDDALLESANEVLSYYKEVEKPSDRKAGF